MLVLAGADIDTQAVHVPSVYSVHTHVIVSTHVAHTAPENAGQLVHVAETVSFLYVPAAQGSHTSPGGPK